MKISIALVGTLLASSSVVLASPFPGWGGVTASTGFPAPTAGPTGTGTGGPAPTGGYYKRHVHLPKGGPRVKRGMNFLSEGSWNETATEESAELVKRVLQPRGSVYPTGTAPAGPTGTGSAAPSGTGSWGGYSPVYPRIEPVRRN